MSYLSIYNPFDMTYYVERATTLLGEGLREADVALSVHKPGDMEFSSQMRRAFEFLRATSGGHYTSSTLMRVLDIADGGHEDGAAPYLLTASQAVAYDPDTEVKKGGTLGVLVQLNDGQGRALLSVAPRFHRQGVASALLTLHQNLLGHPSFWVGRSNTTAQMFLLARGYTVEQMNSRGALRYGMFMEEGEQE